MNDASNSPSHQTQPHPESQPKPPTGGLKPTRALLSVSDKRGLVKFAQELARHGVELLSTGGTAKALQDAGLQVTEVSDYTQFPEILEGRVKTLHPKIHGGILMRPGQATDKKDAVAQNIRPIDLVVVNLYPFEQTVDREGVTEEEAIEQIDIGGVALLRAAAKNFQHVAVVTAFKDYQPILNELEEKGEISLETRRKLAIAAFEKTTHYDGVIASHLKNRNGAVELLNLHYEKVRKLRYGENPHQKAVFFRDPANHYPNVTNAKLLQDNKELSFNNILDVDAALKLVTEFDRGTVAIIKHTNPCGVASAESIENAFELAYKVDTQSAFGSVIAMNRPCTEAIAKFILEHKIFVEIIAAPGFEKGALKRLGDKKNMRLLETGELRINPCERDIKSVSGGILVQNADLSIVTREDLKVVTRRPPTDDEIEAMLFARKVVKHVKSNAVVFAKVDHEQGLASTASERGRLHSSRNQAGMEGATLAPMIEVVTAIGAGQMSRVDSVFIARHKGGEPIKGSVMASDAFFPFSDAVQEAYEAGATGIIQPGGSIRDGDVIAKADELGLAMVFTGVRSFRH